jgi:hypothetical protein
VKTPRSVSHRIWIRGQRWTIRFVQPTDIPDDRDGDCCIVSRLIRIRLGLSPRRMLEVLTHEIAHAACWDLDEEPVEAIGKAVSCGLWAFGWRHQPKPRGPRRAKVG